MERRTAEEVTADAIFKAKQALGGEGILTDSDVVQLKAGVREVFHLMKDGWWHSPDEIRMAAGHGGSAATEGLRRMRELRRWYTIERMRPSQDSRVWWYRLGPKNEERT